MPYELNNPLAGRIQSVINDQELPEVLVALLTVTVNALHQTEGREFREKLEAAYIKALKYVSAVEEQLQASTSLFEDAGDCEKLHLGEMYRKVMNRLFGGHHEPDL